MKETIESTNLNTLFKSIIIMTDLSSRERIWQLNARFFFFIYTKTLPKSVSKIKNQKYNNNERRKYTTKMKSSQLKSGSF